MAIVVAVGHSLLFFAAVQDSDRLDAADVERDHRLSQRENLRRIFCNRSVDFVVLGRNYIDVVSQEDDQVLQVEPKKFLFFFTFSRVIWKHQNFLVYASARNAAVRI